MEIRRLAERDIEDLGGLYEQFFGTESCVDKMRATFPKLDKNPNYAILVAEKNGYVVGTAMGIVCDELYGDCRPFLVIEDVIVDKDHRRSGAGTALMRELERWGADNGCYYVIFVTESDRIEAHRFYESLGYKPDGHKGFKKRL